MSFTPDTDAPWDHPAHQTYSDLFETLTLAARWLSTPGHVLDQEMAERLESACSDAIRYVYNTHCELAPSWLAVLAELFQALHLSVRVTTTMVSDARH